MFKNSILLYSIFLLNISHKLLKMALKWPTIKVNVFLVSRQAKGDKFISVAASWSWLPLKFVFPA